MSLVVAVGHCAHGRPGQVALRCRQASLQSNQVTPIMNALAPFWSIKHPCEQSLVWVQRQLSGAGMQLQRTFDLHEARLAGSDCQCPHHGTSACDCQMVVALVYVQGHPPVSLVVHGNDGQSWISLIDRPTSVPIRGSSLPSSRLCKPGLQPMRRPNCLWIAASLRATHPRGAPTLALIGLTDPNFGTLGGMYAALHVGIWWFSFWRP